MTALGGRTHKRSRSTAQQMLERYDALYEIVSEAKPTGVRFTYYRAVAKGLVPKTNNGYVMVQRALKHLRDTGRVPYWWIVDTSRWRRGSGSWDSVEKMLAAVSSSYRRNYWLDNPALVEVWCESESVAGVLGDVTTELDVDLYPMKGQTSDSFAYGAAQQYRHERREVVVLYVGDLDPSGLEIESQLRAKLQHHSGRTDIEFRRVACTPQHVEQYHLIGTPPKKRTYLTADGLRHGFTGEAVEVEAIDPPLLRSLLRSAIEPYLDEHVLRIAREVEASERQYLTAMIGGAR